jgi:hypothetical protein
MNNLKEIIRKTDDKPTIVNPDSNFVVITYWWGRGNLNNNTARPCVSYYEDFFKKILNLCLNSLKNLQKMNPEKMNLFMNEMDNKVVELKVFKNILKTKITEYLINIYSYAGIKDNESDKDNKAMKFLEKMKLNKKMTTPKDYEFKNENYLFIIFYFAAKEYIKINMQHIIELFNIKMESEELKVKFMNRETSINYKKRLNELKNQKSKIEDAIKKSLNIKNEYTISHMYTGQFKKLLDKFYQDSTIQNKSLNEILVQELRYLNPLKFEEMIENWKNQCSKNNCNYLAVEYSEFAKPGGYQMAINAKPLFIQKCLDLCDGRSVLYIDGDMNIRKYPILFDLTDVDYMARGWWIDPRSSYKLDESISYDPYNFETSGGTMFFSSSEESRLLLDMWISESDKVYQKGKADDRIISMIFNSKKMLLNMKIIQLPIEYLWLTLDYNDRLLESEIYDYNSTLMDSSIIIDHPECLTSEDTASGSGASSDRTPKFYNFLEENIDPVSENFYEYLAFPEIKYTEGVKDYFKFMGETFYIDDGNPILYEKGFVEEGRNTSDNEQPLYVFPYEKKYGPKNKLSDIIIKRGRNMKIDGLFEYDPVHNLAIIEKTQFMKEEDTSKKDPVKLIALMYALLNQGKNILYKPNTANSEICENFISKLDTQYKNTEFAFVPIFNGKRYSDIFRPQIDTNNCIYISHKSDFMKNFITMFESLDDISEFINNGFYQLMSSVRVSYLMKKKSTVLTRKSRSPSHKSNSSSRKSRSPSDKTKIVGGNKINIDFEKEYMDAVKYIEQMKNKSKYVTKSKSQSLKKRKTYTNKYSIKTK